MNRRSFLRTAGAAAVTPLLPAPSLAAAPVAAVNEFQMGWATFLSRVHAQATPDLIERWLQISPAQAQTVLRELVTRGVVRAPVAGSALAVKPMYSTSTVPGLMSKSRNAVKKARDILGDMDATPEPRPNVRAESDYKELQTDSELDQEETGADIVDTRPSGHSVSRPVSLN